MVINYLSIVSQTGKRLLLALLLSGAAMHIAAMENKTFNQTSGTGQTSEKSNSTENPYFGLLPHELIAEISQKCANGDSRQVFTLLSVNKQFQQALSSNFHELDFSYVPYCYLTDQKLLFFLRHLPELTSLNLEGCTHITGDGFAEIAQLRDLTKLSLLCCRQITDAGLAHLAQLKDLQVLNLCGCDKITNAGLAHLAQLKQLKKLNLECCDKITNAGLVHLAQLKNLTILDLRGSNITRNAADQFCTLHPGVTVP